MTVVLDADKYYPSVLTLPKPRGWDTPEKIPFTNVSHKGMPGYDIISYYNRI